MDHIIWFIQSGRCKKLIRCTTRPTSRVYNELLLDKPGQRYTLQALVRSWWTQEINTPSSTIIINCQTRGGDVAYLHTWTFWTLTPEDKDPRSHFPSRSRLVALSQCSLCWLAGWLNLHLSTSLALGLSTRTWGLDLPSMTPKKMHSTHAIF